MTSDIAVLSDLDEYYIFRSIKADVFLVNNVEEARKKMVEISSKYKIIFINIDLALQMGDDLNQYDEQTYPIVTVLPSSKSESRVGMDKILKMAKETLGIDVFKE